MGANLHQFLPTILNFLVIHPYFLTFVSFFPILFMFKFRKFRKKACETSLYIIRCKPGRVGDIVCGFYFYIIEQSME